MAKSKGKGKNRSSKFDGVGPTPEQSAKGDFVVEPITEKGQVIGIAAYKRNPHFETLRRRGDISDDQVRALRFYRDAFEIAARSETRSCLDFSPRGGGDGPLLENLGWSLMYETCERPVGALRDVLRAIAIDDKTYAQVAMDKFGAREVDFIIVPKGKAPARSEVRMAPKSGRHPTLIKEEFLSAVDLMAKEIAPYLRTAA